MIHGGHAGCKDRLVYVTPRDVLFEQIHSMTGYHAVWVVPKLPRAPHNLPASQILPRFPISSSGLAKKKGSKPQRKENKRPDTSYGELEPSTQDDEPSSTGSRLAGGQGLYGHAHLDCLAQWADMQVTWKKRLVLDDRGQFEHGYHLFGEAVLSD